MIGHVDAQNERVVVRKKIISRIYAGVTRVWNYGRLRELNCRSNLLISFLDF